MSPFNVPKEALARDCDCTKRKKKARKARAPRTVCASGTYKQTAKSIKYTPKRKVPCAAGDIPKPANQSTY